MKQKHRRRGRFVVTGWRAHDDRLDEFLLARRGADSELRPAGSASLGLSTERRDALVAALREHELAPAGPRRPRARWVEPVVEVIADHHGPEGGPVRDAVLRDIVLP